MELLHVGSLAGCALAAGCAAAENRREHWRELALALVMAAAMGDALVLGGLVPVVVWSAAIAVLAIVTMARRDRRTATQAVRRRRATGAVVSVLMAALMLFMGGAPGASAEAHRHAASGPAVITLLIVVAVASAAMSARGIAGLPARARVHDASMAVSLLLMAGAAGVAVLAAV